MKSNTQIKAIDQKRNTTTVANKISKNFRAKAEPKPPVSFAAFVNNSTKQNPKTNTTFVFFPFFHSVEDSVSIEWLLFVCLFVFFVSTSAPSISRSGVSFSFLPSFFVVGFFLLFMEKGSRPASNPNAGIVTEFFFFYRIFAPT